MLLEVLSHCLGYSSSSNFKVGLRASGHLHIWRQNLFSTAEQATVLMCILLASSCGMACDGNMELPLFGLRAVLYKASKKYAIECTILQIPGVKRNV
jgi:hypothetical protein